MKKQTIAQQIEGMITQIDKNIDHLITLKHGNAGNEDFYETQINGLKDQKAALQKQYESVKNNENQKTEIGEKLDEMWEDIKNFEVPSFA